VSASNETAAQQRRQAYNFNAQTSSKCLAFLAEAELEATNLAYPTLTAAIDKAGDGQVLVSYDLMNLRAITLNQELALAECRVNEILTAAKALQKLSARRLSKPGLLAKIRLIDAYQARIAKMRTLLDTAVASEKIKEKSKDRVLKSLLKLKEKTNKLRAKARLQKPA